MDVYYLPNGEKIDTMSAKTLFEHDNDSYNGFYSVTVQDEDGQVYSETACVIFRQLILLQESQHLQEQLVQSRV